MDLAFTPEEQKFADEVRAFVRANLPADVRDKVKNGKHLIRDDYMRWQQALGWRHCRPKGSGARRWRRYWQRSVRR